MDKFNYLQSFEREVEIYKMLIYLIERDKIAEENGEKCEDESY